MLVLLSTKSVASPGSTRWRTLSSWRLSCKKTSKRVDCLNTEDANLQLNELVIADAVGQMD